MKKTIKVIEQETFCFDKPEEVKLLKELINYCWHRAYKHNTPITQFKDKIEKLRCEMGIINIKKDDKVWSDFFGGIE